MRAAHITQHGAPPELVDIPEPVPGPGQALIAVTATPITPLDVLCATGTSYFGPPALPYVPGVQGVGVVVTSPLHDPGTRVWFPTSAGMAPGDGSLAERAVADAADLVPITADVPDALVAALGYSAIAAWMSLTWRGELKPGERVLVLGAGGVVGQVALQSARLLGASAVYAACRSDGAVATAESLGADGIVRLRDDDQVDDLAAQIRAATGAPIDLVIDPLCGVPATAAAQCLAPGGRLVNLGSSAGTEATFTSALLRGGSQSILGYTNNSLTAVQRRAALDALIGHAASGGLTVAHEAIPHTHAAASWQRQAIGVNDRRLVVDLT
ncbi:quinone oxidoreductase family protein [Nocardioides sp. T2.26MG-1]|uniref:quinone oxidoreductase family protein n=1 Tax=Nocardioides sp. T2.26MG-1 TaxID=3041166 RepID=UPI002477CA2E|nr:zinc-binding alcohol dehydrogenase family protein [Nocardioides sp. T2.26MG-1]CAI9412312.1 L-threonine 3-dehydrogenase [Nocardioides sp. T2.26MG-1]